MTDDSPDFNAATAVSVGRIVAPHGIRGEVKVESLTDFPERFIRGAKVWLKSQERRIESSRRQGKLFLIKLNGIETRTDAESLRGEDLRVPRAFRITEADTYYQDDIVGLRVEDTSGNVLGTVATIFETGSNDVYVVKGDQGELLVPAVEDVVQEVDVANGRLVIDLVPGLEFSKAPQPQRHRPPSRAPEQPEPD